MLRLRQIAWVARDLETSASQVAEHLDLEVCYVDPGVGTFGLENRLFCVGDQFLEIVSPVQDGTTAGRFLDKLGVQASGYMVIFQTTADLDTVRSAAVDGQVRIVFEAPGGSAEDGTAIHGIHFHPADVGGAIVSIDRCEQPAEWAWAGPTWRNHVRTDVVRSITGVTIETPNPTEAATTWAALLGVEAAGTTVPVDDAVVSFVAGDRGVVGIDFDGPAERSFDLLGTQVEVSPS